MRFEKMIAVLLVGAMLCGCASREVYFTSTPLGATVQVGKRRGVTPCTLKVPSEVESATFRLPTGEEQTLPLPHIDGELDYAADLGGIMLGGTLMVAGGIVAGAGLLLFISGVPDSEEDEFDRWQDDEDDHWNGEAVGYGLVGMLAGGAVFFLGKWIYPDDDIPCLRADFMEDKPQQDKENENE